MTLTIPADVARALDEAAASQPDAPERDEMVLRGLRDWLTSLGLLPHREPPDHPSEEN